MTLANLLAIQRLQAFNATPAGVQRLLAAAARNLADAQLQALSPENRFDAAYKAILQCAMLGLWAHGYRTSTQQPGHHQTALQALPLTMGLPNDVIIVLDALRKQRNLNDYEGDPVGDAVVAECIAQAGQLLAHTRQCLQSQFPHLLAAQVAGPQI
ncbi:DNA-binding protein [Xylophilus sp. GW821-FHT01B05]